MKKAILFLLFITLFGISRGWSQKSLDDYYNDNLEGYKANDLEKMKSSSESMIKYYSDKFGSFYLYAY